jgi:hypothetical protein
VAMCAIGDAIGAIGVAHRSAPRKVIIAPRQCVQVSIQIFNLAAQVVKLRPRLVKVFHYQPDVLAQIDSISHGLARSIGQNESHPSNGSGCPCASLLWLSGFM